MKKFCRVFALLAVLTLVVAGCAFADSKIAVVNSQVVMRNHPRADQTLKRLEAMMRAKQQEAMKEAEKATTKEKKAEVVGKKQREAAEEERKLLQPLEKEVFAAIRTVSRAKGCDVVCEAGAVILGGVDITQDVINELKKKK